jgi:hypothetical protein
VALRARNRLVIVETAGGSLAIFPPSHKFFFAREIELNLGYVWYRKDDDHTFSAGVRQAEHEEEYRPWGVSAAEWERRVEQSRHNLGNLWRRLVLPKRINGWSSTSLQQRLVKTGGRLLKHARYCRLLLAESHLTRRLFGAKV